MAEKPIVATVAFYWIKYLGDIFRDIRNPKVICLKRRREEVIESFAGMYKDKNFWSDPKGDKFTGIDPKVSPLGEMWPKYNLLKEEAIGKYWDEYYAIAEAWIQMFPEQMIIVDMHSMFNNEKYQRVALKFLGIKKPVIDLDIKKNATAERVTPLILQDAEMPVEDLREVYRNQFIFGQAAYAKGIPIEANIQLSDADWERLIASPEYKNIPKTGEENGSIHNREGGSG